MAHLVEELNQGAVSHGFPGQIWTRARVNVIGRLFGVSYDLTQLGHLLKKVGWNDPPRGLQKPTRKAHHRDAGRQKQQKVQQWRQETVPDFKKCPR